MSTEQIRKRIERIEETLAPEHKREFSLEQLCRLMWRLDRKRYLEMVAEGDPRVRFFRQQFELEDAERAATR